MASVNHFGLLL